MNGFSSDPRSFCSLVLSRQTCEGGKRGLFLFSAREDRAWERISQTLDTDINSLRRTEARRDPGASGPGTGPGSRCARVAITIAVLNALALCTTFVLSAISLSHSFQIDCTHFAPKLLVRVSVCCLQTLSPVCLNPFLVELELGNIDSNGFPLLSSGCGHAGEIFTRCSRRQNRGMVALSPLCAPLCASVNEATLHSV